MRYGRKETLGALREFKRQQRRAGTHSFAGSESEVYIPPSPSLAIANVPFFFCLPEPMQICWALDPSELTLQVEFTYVESNQRDAPGHRPPQTPDCQWQPLAQRQHSTQCEPNYVYNTNPRNLPSKR